MQPNRTSRFLQLLCISVLVTTPCFAASVFPPIVTAKAGVYTNETTHLFGSGPASLNVGIASLTVFAPVPSLSGWILLLLCFALAAIGLSRVS